MQAVEDVLLTAEEFSVELEQRGSGLAVSCELFRTPDTLVPGSLHAEAQYMTLKRIEFRVARMTGCLAVALAISVRLSADAPQRDTSAQVTFQRAADSYAFLHRQVERKLGAGVADAEMANALREARAGAKIGDFFGPEIAAVVKQRIAAALRTPGCTVSAGAAVRIQFNQLIDSATALPACVTGALPGLPEELHYRSTGTTLLLVDSHVNFVVDILEDAFPRTQ